MQQALGNSGHVQTGYCQQMGNPYSLEILLGFLQMCIRDRYYIEDQVYELEPGQLLVIPPGRMHRPVIFDSSAYKRMVLWINVDYLHSLKNHTELLTEKLNLFNGTSGYLIHLKEESFSFLLGIFNHLIPLAKNKSPLVLFQQKFFISALLGKYAKNKKNSKISQIYKRN